jgi:deoxyribodipyrimidine photo-lyase
VESYAVDSSCVVPASCIPARSYAAYSIRPKIQKLLPEFLKPAPPVKLDQRFEGQARGLPEGQIADLVASCEIDHNVRPSAAFRGGRKEAERHLRQFLEDRLRRYSSEKNEPSAHATSELSPYLHFGYIGPLEVALAVREYATEHKLVAAEFLEELIVRRELAFNFVRYSRKVDSLEELPDWARATLDQHRHDPREAVYSRDQFETAGTCDDLWNATQKELLLRGKIHGYYRMYWGKKIVEWSATPEEALATMIHLHDRYALDGQDPNTYTNILWCFGLHDRPWGERPVFGAVRWMSRAGMDRKTDTKSYIKEIEYLERTGKELIT